MKTVTSSRKGELFNITNIPVNLNLILSVNEWSMQVRDGVYEFFIEFKPIDGDSIDWSFETAQEQRHSYLFILDLMNNYIIPEFKENE